MKRKRADFVRWRYFMEEVGVLDSVLFHSHGPLLDPNPVVFYQILTVGHMQGMPDAYVQLHLRPCCCCCIASVVSDSVRPHRRQPTRLPRPWDSPGKSTGVGCHFILQCMKVKSESEVAQSCPTLSDPMDCSPPGSSVHGIF